MIDDIGPVVVVHAGDGGPGVRFDDERVVATSVATPAALADALAERPAGCVVAAPDDADWDLEAVLSTVADHDADVVVVTAGDLAGVVGTGTLSAVRDVVRPGDEAALVERVREAAADARERERERRAVERYRALADRAPVPVGTLDADGAFNAANDAMATLLGFEDPAELVGREAISFVAAEGRSVSAERLTRVIEEREATSAVQRTLVDATGERKYVVSAMHPVTVAGGPGAQVVLNDITEHKRLEAALREQRDRFSTLFENLNEPVVETRFEGETPVVEAVNGAFAETFGVDPEAAVGESLDDLIVPVADRADAVGFNRRARAGERLEVEVTRRTPDGPRDFLLRFAPYEHDGERGGYAIYVDITERREWERQLRRQNERLEEVAAVVSHDLRNPLNVAVGAVDLLAADADEDEREHFERVERAHDRMAAIIDDMLTLARQGQSVSDEEPVSLAAVARDAWETTDTRGATLDVRADATVMADGTRLRQALENLFRNAVEHAGPDVTVRVGDLPDCPTDGSDDRTDAGRGDADGRDAVGEADLVGPDRRRSGFYVEDDGPGIPEDEREEVFESGYTTADEGTGFGLAIVQSVVEAHGWDVTLTESDAGGARFEITGVERVE